MARFLNSRDVAAGAFLLLFAAFVLWSTWDLPIGQGVRLGPGFMPVVLSGLIGLFGLGIMAAGIVRAAGDSAPWSFSLRGLVCVLGSIAVFGLLVERAGLAVAAPALLLVAGFAFGRPKALETTVFVVGLTVVSIVLFVYALGLTMPVFP